MCADEDVFRESSKCVQGQYDVMKSCVIIPLRLREKSISNEMKIYCEEEFA